MKYTKRRLNDSTAHAPWLGGGPRGSAAATSLAGKAERRPAGARRAAAHRRASRFHTALFVLYEKSLMKYAGVHESGFAARG